MLVRFNDEQWRLWSNGYLITTWPHKIISVGYLALIKLQFLRPPGLPFSDMISPSSAFTALERKRRRERENQGGRWTELKALTPLGLPGKGTDLASHHTQPASAHVWACMWVHLLAKECMTGKALKDGRIVSKWRIRKDNREPVRRQGKIKLRVCVWEKNNRKKLNKFELKSHEECDCGWRLHRCRREEAKGVIDYS